MLNLVTIMAKATNVSVVELEALILRGVKPTKALYRLGVDQQIAGMIGTLKIASTEEEINTVYANEQVKSCMTCKPVGGFYSAIGMSVLYNDRFRVLVDLKTGWRSGRGYGVLCYKLDDLLFNSGIFNTDTYLVQPSEKVKIEFGLIGYRVIRSVNIDNDVFIPYLDEIDIELVIQLPVSLYEAVRIIDSDGSLPLCDYKALCNLLPYYEEKVEEENYEDMYINYFNVPSIDSLDYLGKDSSGNSVYLECKRDSFYHFYTSEGFYKRTDCFCTHTIEINNEGQPIVNVFDDLPF